MKPFFLSTATIIGATIGAGIFALPYVFARFGFGVSLLILIVSAFVLTIIYQLYGQIILKTKEKHRLVGYTRLYLGRGWEWVILAETIFGYYATALVYLILGGQFLTNMFDSRAMIWVVFFWGVGSFLLFLGIRMIAWTEILFSGLMITLVGILFYWGDQKIHWANLIWLGNNVNLSLIVLSIGVVLSSLLSSASIPEAIQILQQRRLGKLASKSVFLGIAWPVLLYLFFVLVVVGVCGNSVSADAISGLKSFLGMKAIWLGSALGLVAIFSSFLVLGAYLRDVFYFDYHIKKQLANWLTVLPPIFFYLIGFRDFVKVLGLSGLFIGIIEGVMIVTIYLKMRSLQKTSS